MRRVLRNSGLSIALLTLFVVFLAGQSVAGHRRYNSEQREHGQPPVSYGAYLAGPEFLEATMEI